MVAGSILLVALAGYTAFPKPNVAPNFAFLRNAQLVKTQTLYNPAQDARGVVWTYRLKGEFVPLRRKIFDELKPLGFQNAGGGGGLVGMLDHPRPLQPAFDPAYQLFQSRNTGVEIVEEEPATWELGDRQTLWDPGSGTRDPGVVTVFVTRSIPGGGLLGWWHRLKGRFGIP